MKTNSIKILLITIFCSILILSSFSTIANTNIEISETKRFKPINLSDSLDQSQELCNSMYAFGTFVGYGSFDVYSCQSFIPQIGKLTRVEIFLAKDPEDPVFKNANLAIRETVSGEDLTTASVYYNQVPPFEDPEWIEFDFPDIHVTVGKTYYIVCSVDWTPYGNSMYAWGASGNNPYPMGEMGFSNDGGETWEYYMDDDHSFRTYGTAPDLEIGEIEGGFGKINVNIKNNFDSAINDIDYTITVYGGIFDRINIESEDVIDSLDVGESIDIASDGLIIGLGSIDIMITAECDEIGEVSKIQSGFVLLFFIIFS